MVIAYLFTYSHLTLKGTHSSSGTAAWAEKKPKGKVYNYYAATEELTYSKCARCAKCSRDFDSRTHRPQPWERERERTPTFPRNNLHVAQAKVNGNDTELLKNTERNGHKKARGRLDSKFVIGVVCRAKLWEYAFWIAAFIEQSVCTQSTCVNSPWCIAKFWFYCTKFRLFLLLACPENKSTLEKNNVLIGTNEWLGRHCWGGRGGNDYQDERNTVKRR